MHAPTCHSSVKIKDFFLGKGHPLALISGPCVIENEDIALKSAEFLVRLCDDLKIPLIYKSSYDKANRSSVHSYRGPGLDVGLTILEKVKTTFAVPVFTDVHTPSECRAAAQVCDVLQIPAFLCRQTDLLIAAGQTGAVINLKKGQFMAPWDMKHAIDKLLSTNNANIILTERGSCFGYNNLVTDLRSIPIMAKWNFPVCFDASHSVQLPGGQGACSGGQTEFIPHLSNAAVAAGAHLLYIESHFEPKKGKSDTHSMLPWHQLGDVLKKAKAIHQVVWNV